MRKRFRRAFDISGIVILVLVLTLVVQVSSDGEIYFSKSSGYYDNAFSLEIRGGSRILNRKIYYTLDGSEPTQEDYLYDRGTPIFIEDATSQENRYAARTDIGIPTWRDAVEYKAPDYNIDKCNVVRASVFDEEGNCLNSITSIYFVGFQDKNGYEGLYTASIVTDPDNLFDPKKGIYIEGFSEKNNFNERGADWEREATLTLFDEQQRQILTQDCGIRIKGGTSRTFAQKSIRCYARDEYCGSNKFQLELFRKGHLPHRIALFAGGNQYAWKIEDPMIQKLTKSLNYSTLDFIPCVLFLNGEYWGVYHISEDYDDAYIKDHYDVRQENIVLIKAGYLKEGEDSDYDDYLEMRRFMTEEDMSVPGNYAQACRIMDMDSYIDYYAMGVYIQRHEDWPNLNFALWKTREDEGSEYGDGRWRWMLYDVNSAQMDAIVYDSLYEVLCDDEMFRSLYQNEEFRRQFAERILYIGRDLLNAENCTQFLDEYERTMKTALTESNRRFYSSVNIEEFDDKKEWLITFFENRYDAVWDFLVDNMGEEWLRQNGIQK